MSDREMTSAQKAAETRKRHKVERKAKRKNQKEMTAALERIIKSDSSTWEDVHNALFLLAELYRR